MQRISFLSTIYFLVSLLVTASGHPQDATPTDSDRMAEQARSSLKDPSLLSEITTGRPQITVISSGDATSLRAEAGVAFDMWSLALRVQTAIEEGQKEANLADFDGLTGGSQASFLATRILLPANLDLRGASSVCTEYNDAMGRPGPVAVPEMCTGAKERVAYWDAQRGKRSLSKEEEAAAEAAAIYAQELLRRSEEAAKTVLIATCAEYNTTTTAEKIEICSEATAVKAVLSDEWDAKLDARITEAVSRVCLQDCATRFAERVEAWDALPSNRKKTKLEDAKEQRDREWNDRFLTAEQEALTTICTDYNKAGLGPILPRDCRNVDRVKGVLPDSWDAKLVTKLTELTAKVCENYNATQPASWGWLVSEADSSGCTYSALQRKGDEWAYRAARAANFSPAILSFSSTLKHQTFQWVDVGLEVPGEPKNDVLGDPNEQSKFGVAVGASYGKLLFTRRTPVYLGGGGTLSRAFEAAPKTEVCQPSNTQGVTLCRDVAIKGPGEKDSQKLYVESRFFPWSKLGMIPRLTYEFEDHTYGAQLTSFFLVHETKGLNGGIDVGYRDDGKGLRARLFIGVSFSIFPGTE